MEDIIPHPSCDFVSPDISMVVAKQEGSTARSTFSTSLQVVLGGLLQYLLTTGKLLFMVLYKKIYETNFNLHMYNKNNI